MQLGERLSKAIAERKCSEKHDYSTTFSAWGAKWSLSTKECFDCGHTVSYRTTKKEDEVTESFPTLKQLYDLYRYDRPFYQSSGNRTQMSVD
jgi:hypothetical protein